MADPQVRSVLPFVGHAVDSGVAIVQRAREKSRQEQVDKYNRQVQARAFTAQQIANSPSYQYQRMKDAGINPLAQGIQPEQQGIQSPSPLSPSPIPPVESSMGEGFNEALTQEAVRQQQELQAKQLDIEQEKLNIQKSQIEFQQNKEKAEVYRELFAKDYITKEQCDEGTKPFGFVVEGKGKDSRLVEAQILDTEASERLKNEQTTKTQAETAKLWEETKIAQTEAKWRDRKLRKELERTSAEILNMSYQDEEMKANTELAHTAKEIADIRALIYKCYGTEDVPNDLKSELIGRVKRNFDGYFQGRLLSEKGKKYMQFLEDTRELEIDLGSASKWNRWVNTVAQGVGVVQSAIPTKIPPRRPVGFNPTPVYQY